MSDFFFPSKVHQVLYSPFLVSAARCLCHSLALVWQRAVPTKKAASIGIDLKAASIGIDLRAAALDQLPRPRMAAASMPIEPSYEGEAA